MKLFYFSLTSALGQLFIFYCLKEFDALTLSTVTTTRKFVTIVITGILYPDEALSMNQWSCVLIVFVGLILDDVFGKSGGHGGKGAKAASTTPAKQLAATAEKVKGSEADDASLELGEKVRGSATKTRGKSPAASKRAKTPAKKSG
jgi:hypothetical protein